MTCNRTLLPMALLLLAANAFADQPEDDAAVASDETVVAESDDEANGPKTMSGMSILGNEEAPKSLVIVPWKSSEMGDDISLSNTVDELAKPVDKEVFERELQFYEIRSGENF